MSDMVSDDPSGAVGRWLPVAQAAPAFGLQERTLRRRIQKGHYQTRETAGRLEVFVTSDLKAVDTSAMSDSPPDTTPDTSDTAVTAIREMRTLVERERERSASLEAELRQAREAAAMYQERARGLQEETAQLRAQLALPAPQPPTPWWAFWRRRG